MSSYFFLRNCSKDISSYLINLCGRQSSQIFIFKIVILYYMLMIGKTEPGLNGQVNGTRFYLPYPSNTGIRSYETSCYGSFWFFFIFLVFILVQMVTVWISVLVFLSFHYCRILSISSLLRLSERSFKPYTKAKIFFLPA